MSFDFTSLGIANDAEEQAEEQEEQAENEQEEPREEQPAPTPQQEPKKPKVDRTKPLEERIKEEAERLSFAAGVMGDYQRAASSTFCHHLLDVLADPREEQRASKIRAKFDENEWTFDELFGALGQRFKKELGNNYGVIGGDVVMGWATEIITESKPKDHKPTTPPVAPNPPTAKPKPTAKAEKPEPKAKEEPKKDHEQLKLNFSALFD